MCFTGPLATAFSLHASFRVPTHAPHLAAALTRQEPSAFFCVQKLFPLSFALLTCHAVLFPTSLRPTFSRLSTSNPNFYWKLSLTRQGSAERLPQSGISAPEGAGQGRDGQLGTEPWGGQASLVETWTSRVSVSLAPSQEARMFSASLLPWANPQLVALDHRNASRSNLCSSALDQKTCPRCVILPLARFSPHHLPSKE